MSAPPPVQQPAKVLIVDDQPANLLALEAVLQELGAELVRAGSGEQALMRTLQEDFAAILLDVRMPGMDGFEAASMIRARARSRMTPILFVTAADDADMYMEDAYALGAVDFLAKPLHPAALKAKVAFFIELHRHRQAQREAAAAHELAVREQARREAAEAAAQRLTSEVTERMNAEDRLRRLAAELAEADRRKTEFLAVLAHELRNPLAPLRNGLHVLRLSGDEEARTRTWRTMDRQLAHMVRLIDDLLDIARVSTGKMELKKQRVQLRQLLETAVETAQPLIDHLGHTLEVEQPTEPVWLEVDPTRVAQVVSNLLTNAAKYTPGHGRIHLRARRDERQLRIAVTDNGIGIAPEALSRVFQMFTQVSRETQYAPGGLGIGLALVEALVRMHGGTIDADSDGPGHGSTFTVSLPLTPQQDNEAPRPPAHPQPQANGAGLDVLVVDDNKDAAESLALILQMDGHVARVANDGRRALEMAREFKPQVVFLDIGMPGMDGYEVARALLQEAGGAYPRPVLVALTGWGAQEDLARTEAAGFDHHLTKPADIADVEKLLAGLREEA